ncbi:phosphohydrolase [Candidatus Scalindua japonica]|uniref:Phosphohydrolase n=1 Tax=Candidatus Scalindua japonica TaxID=1284222 RepID=A0A286TVL2_9BACT|nr:metallophosphoesterase [Candidatus Scalindua japonica]GAX59871.1 phosphohydrolase [Candidatus Scalindua japonica]
MNRFGIIQLSDLQFGSKHRFGNPSNIYDALSIDINYLSEKFNFQTLYLLLTGDITETGHADEFNEAIKAIDLLSKKIAVDQRSILCVPGNHDINWKLSVVASEVGDSNLKYNNYNKFTSTICNTQSQLQSDKYERYFDHRIGVEILLLNSCEIEDHETHIGYIDKTKLLETLKLYQNSDCSDYTKICISHHRIEPGATSIPSIIRNSDEIETILIENGYSIALTGHIHANKCKLVTQEEKTIIYSGAGSAGVDKAQREDGIPNQYTVHVIDSHNKKIESFWRSYSPTKRTKFGLGAWTEDVSFRNNPMYFDLPKIINFNDFSANNSEDLSLLKKYSIKSNPFTISNAEKISASQIIKLFVSSEGRNKGAVRPTGDAIIRGSRGSGKTMLLRYLDVLGQVNFDENFANKKVSESFPVLVNISLIHNSEWKSSSIALIESAEKLIFESVIKCLNDKNNALNSLEFKNSLFKLKQKLNVLKNQEGSLIWKLGVAIKEHMSNYFTHVLLLIDEVAPVFPKEFFMDSVNGFLRWMNSIRNSGPFFTRIAVYPNDMSDILNEERFGTVINLDYNIKNEEEYQAYRNYCIELVNKYLKIVSQNKLNPSTVDSIINLKDSGEEDSLEQLIYASDGSSRRFTSLMDKCLTSNRWRADHLFDKNDIYEIISEFSNNLFSSYDLTEKEIATSLAKACRKQITYRFRLPNLTGLVNSLHAKNEELNIVKIAEIGRGTRGTIYEFTYPFCISMDIQTHHLKDTKRICTSRDRTTGEWISQVTKITRDQLDYLNKEPRLDGVIIEVDDDIVVITDLLSKKEFVSESFGGNLKIGDRVSFIPVQTIASDIIKSK